MGVFEPVIVTGSWIPQQQQVNASPVVTTAEDIGHQGFQNIFDVLRAQPLSTGAVQLSASFAPGATTISLLGRSEFHGPVGHPDRDGRGREDRRARVVTRRAVSTTRGLN